MAFQVGISDSCWHLHLFPWAAWEWYVSRPPSGYPFGPSFQEEDLGSCQPLRWATWELHTPHFRSALFSSGNQDTVSRPHLPLSLSNRPHSLGREFRVSSITLQMACLRNTFSSPVDQSFSMCGPSSYTTNSTHTCVLPEDHACFLTAHTPFTMLGLQIPIVHYLPKVFDEKS